jgi:hypothetical protein
LKQDKAESDQQDIKLREEGGKKPDDLLMSKTLEKRPTDKKPSVGETIVSEEVEGDILNKSTFSTVSYIYDPQLMVTMTEILGEA